jgi:hypothetical protein
MWTCDKCREQHADHFSTCWKCAGMEAPPRTASVGASSILPCARCNSAMEPLGKRRLPGAGGDGLLGELGELFTSRERLEAFACTHCGSVEFFLERVGLDYRAQTSVAPAAPVTAPLTATVEAKFQHACALEEQGQVEVALARFEELAVRFPGTNFARDAEERLRKIRERLKF